MFERHGQGEELAEGIPTQVVFGFELLNVLRCGTAGAGFEQAATLHQGHDGKHLGRGAELEDGEEVGEVVTQDVAGHRDCVESAADLGLLIFLAFQLFFYLQLY